VRLINGMEAAGEILGFFSHRPDWDRDEG